MLETFLSADSFLSLLFDEPLTVKEAINEFQKFLMISFHTQFENAGYKFKLETWKNLDYQTFGDMIDNLKLIEELSINKSGILYLSLNRSYTK